MSKPTQKTVWVVDDDVSIGWVLEKALKKKGYNVLVFRSVKPLLVTLKIKRPDLIISDIQMPGVDGLKLLELMYTNFPSIPVIIMTAYADYETTISSYKKGAFEYLAKPFDIHHVLQTVESALDSMSDVLGGLAVEGDLDEKLEEPTLNWQKAFASYLSAIISSGDENISKKLYQDIDKAMILTALKYSEGHKQKAAKILGWGRNTLTRKMSDLGL